MNINANVVPHITVMVQRLPVTSKNVTENLSKYDLADIIATSVENSEVKLLIGNDYYADIT